MPTQLTTHFAIEEFAVDNQPILSALIPIFTEFAQTILEPIRLQFNQPFIITSGYRSLDENIIVHGKANSEHRATTWMCACDGYVESLGQRFVFDWLRNDPYLPWHELVLEHSPTGSSVIHLSLNKMKPGERVVLEGATHNSEPYISVTHVDFAPKQQEA